MTQEIPTSTFDNEEALAIIMALELITENPDISMTWDGQVYDVSPRYIKAVEPILMRLYEFHKTIKNSQ